MNDLELDQHFLASGKLLLMEAKFGEISQDDVVFEIGCGDGRLSKFLLSEKPKKLIGAEVDLRLESKLKELKSEFSNFEVFFENGLEVFDKVKFDKLIANIPYNITEPLYVRLLDRKTPFFVLLHGKNFYLNFHNEESKWFYLIRSFYEFEKLLDVPGNAFEPVAKTMSVLLKFKLKEGEEISTRDLLLQKIYGKRNRSLKNSIIFALVDLGYSKKGAKELFLDLELNERLLGKKLLALSNSEFLVLYKQLLKIVSVL